jgi:hypothetical protein
MNAEGFGIQVLTGQLIWVTLIPAGTTLMVRKQAVLTLH